MDDVINQRIDKQINHERNNQLHDLHSSPIRVTDTVDTKTITGLIGNDKWIGGILALMVKYMEFLEIVNHF